MAVYRRRFTRRYNGGRTEVARRVTGHSNARTTGLYDRCNDDVSGGEAERMGT
jgi:hypothetical protein